jgi:hypothetical protein
MSEDRQDEAKPQRKRRRKFGSKYYRNEHGPKLVSVSTSLEADILDKLRAIFPDQTIAGILRLCAERMAEDPVQPVMRREWVRRESIDRAGR